MQNKLMIGKVWSLLLLGGVLFPGLVLGSSGGLEWNWSGRTFAEVPLPIIHPLVQQPPVMSIAVVPNEDHREGSRQEASSFHPNPRPIFKFEEEERLGEEEEDLSGTEDRSEDNEGSRSSHSHEAFTSESEEEEERDKGKKKVEEEEEERDKGKKKVEEEEEEADPLMLVYQESSMAEEIFDERSKSNLRGKQVSYPIGLLPSPITTFLLSRRWEGLATLSLRGTNLISFAEVPLPSSLRRLDLGGNGLEALPSWMSSLRSLKELSLDTNNFEELPREICRWGSLRVLDMSHNRLANLSSLISKLSNLQMLTLSHNGLTELPKEMGFLTSLHTLELSNNKFSHFPRELIDLFSLNKLDVSWNSIASLPRELAEMSLTLLNMDGNQFTDLPEVIKNLPRLQALSAAHNLIERFAFQNWGDISLKELNLSYNKLSGLPDGLKAYTLDLSHNFFQEVPPVLLAILENLNGIYEIDLRDNFISLQDRGLVQVAKLLGEESPSSIQIFLSGNPFISDMLKEYAQSQGFELEIESLDEEGIQLLLQWKWAGEEYLQ